MLTAFRHDRALQSTFWGTHFKQHSKALNFSTSFHPRGCVSGQPTSMTPYWTHPAEPNPSKPPMCSWVRTTPLSCGDSSPGPLPWASGLPEPRSVLHSGCHFTLWLLTLSLTRIPGHILKTPLVKVSDGMAPAGKPQVQALSRV